MKRREFTRAQKAQMIKRASDPQGNIWCEGCGLNLTGKPIEIDHTIAEALIIDKAKPLTIDEGKVLGRDCCHRTPGGKTAQDAESIARAKRREAVDLGIRRPTTLRGAGFPRFAPQRKASAPLSRPLPPRRFP